MTTDETGPQAGPSTYEEQMLRVLIGQETCHLITLLIAEPSPRDASPLLRAACIIGRHPRHFDPATVLVAREVTQHYGLRIRPHGKLPGFMEGYTGIKASGSPVSEAILASALGDFYVAPHVTPQAP